MKKSILKIDFLFKLKLVSAFCAWVQVNRMAKLKRKKASAKGKEENDEERKKEGEEAGDEWPDRPHLNVLWN